MDGQLLGVSVLELRTDQRQFDAGLARARATADREGQLMQRSMDRRIVSLGSSMQRVGSSLTRYVSAPLAALGLGAADMAQKFEQAMEMVHTQAGASQKEVDALRGKVLELAKTLPQSPQQLAEGLYHLESIGLRGAKAMDALKIAAQGAAVGNANLEDTATALGSAWLVNIKGAGNLQNTMGTLNAAVGAGNMRMNDLVDALGTGVLPAAKIAGLSLQDVTGAIAVLSDEGTSASRAANLLRTSLHFLYDPSSKAEAGLKSIGLSADKMGADLRKPNGLLVALTDLKTHIDKLAPVKQEQLLGTLFPAGRGWVLQTLMNQLDRYGMKLHQIKRTSSEFGQDVTKTQQTAAYKIHTAWSTIEADAISFGEKVLPSLLAAGDEIVKDVDRVATAFGKLPPGTQHAILTGGLILAGLGPAMKLLGVFTTGIGRLAAVARVAAGLAAGKNWPHALGRPPVGSGGVVSTMEVGSLIARSMIVGAAAGTLGGVGSRGSVGGAIRAGERQTASGVILPAGTRSVLTAEEQLALGGAGGAAEASLVSKLGGLAVRGLGTLGVAAFAAPVALGVGKALHDWFSENAGKEGREFAQKFAAPFPHALSTATVKSLGNARNQVLRDRAATPAGINLSGGKAGTFHAPGPTAAQTFNDLFDEGYRSGKAYVAGFQGVKFPSTPTLIRSMIGHLKELDPVARQQAAKMMLGFAASLEAHGRLPRGAVDKMIVSLHAAFPALLTFLGRMGLASDKQFAEYLKFKQATSTLVSTLKDYRDKFGGFGQDVQLTAANINKYVDVAMKDLKWQMGHGSADARKAATAEWEKLKDAVKAQLTAMESQVATSAGKMHTSIKSGSSQAANDASSNFQRYQNSVLTAMKNGVISTGQGSKLITQALNATLKAFGAKQIPFPTGLQALGSPNFTLPGAVAGAGQSRAGHHAARGMLYQLGQPGEAGRDSIPLSVAGLPVVAAPGETVAVLTRHQRGGLDHLLGRLGGLDGYLGAVNKPNYMAQGGVVSGPSSTFGPPLEPAGGTALAGHSSAEPGISLRIPGTNFADPRNRALMGHLFRVMIAGHTGNLMDIDLGPADWTGRDIDVTGAGARQMGFDPASFPTGALGTALMLGANAVAGGAGVLSSIMAPKVTGTGTISTLTRTALQKATSAANAYLTAHQPAAQAGGAAPGTIIAHGGKPGQVEQAMMAAASQIIGLPYIWGGGHGSFSAPGYDCSGAVSYLLHAAGLLGSPETTDSLKDFGLPGAGKYVTVGVRGSGSSGHTMLNFFGKYLESGGGGPLGRADVHWDTGWDGPFSVYRHPAGFARGGIVGDFGEVDPRLLLLHDPALASSPNFRAYAAGHGMKLGGHKFATNTKHKAAKTPGSTRSHFKLLSDVPGIPGVDKRLHALNSLIDPNSGAVAALQDRINYTGQRDDQKIAAYAANNPDLDSSTGLVTPSDGSAPYVDHKFVSMRLGELEQIYGWQVNVRDDLRHALRSLSPLLRRLHKVIEERKKKIEAIKRQIRANLKKIRDLKHGLTATDPNVLKLRKAINSADVGASATSILGQIEAARALPTPTGKKGDAARNAKGVLIAGLETKLAQARGGQKVSLASLRNQLLDVENADKTRKGDLTDQINTLEAYNVRLGGDGTRIGTSGMIGRYQKQLSTLKGDVSAVLSDRADIQGPSGIGGSLGDAKLAIAPGSDLTLQIAALQPDALARVLATATSTGAGTSTDSGQLLNLLTQWKTNQDLRSSVQGVESSVFSALGLGSLPPFAGIFHSGGTIPGPIGQERMALVQAGERITEIGGGDGDVNVALHFKPGTEWLRDFVKVEIEQSGRGAGRRARRPLPGAGGGLQRPRA